MRTDVIGRLALNGACLAALILIAATRADPVVWIGIGWVLCRILWLADTWYRTRCAAKTQKADDALTPEQRVLGIMVQQLGSHHPATEAARRVLERPRTKTRTVALDSCGRDVPAVGPITITGSGVAVDSLDRIVQLREEEIG